MGRTAYRTRDYLNQGAAQVRERQPMLAGASAAAEAVKQAKSGLAWFGRRRPRMGPQLVPGDRDQNELLHPPGRSSHVALPVARVVGGSFGWFVFAGVGCDVPTNARPAGGPPRRLGVAATSRRLSAKMRQLRHREHGFGSW